MWRRDMLNLGSRAFRKWGTLLQLFFILLLTIACTAPATAEPLATAEGLAASPAPLPTLMDASAAVPEANVVYYQIYGTTETELRSEMDQKGPVAYDGFKGDALTAWDFRWKWSGYGTSVCNLSKAKTYNHITLTLPLWDPPDSADPQLVAKWTRYFNALVIHEKGHVDRAMTHYEGLLPAIQNATCDTAEQAAEQVVIDLRAVDHNYDIETGHGASQGAIFP
jgi:predicted secreted Zn-dependent protease